MKKILIFPVLIFVISIGVFVLNDRKVDAASDFVILADDGTFITGEDTNTPPKKVLNVQAIAKKFYQTNPDDYDFLAIFTDFPTSTFGSYVVKNSTKGIGLEKYYGTDNINNSQLYGSQGKLQAVSVLEQSKLDDVFPDEFDYMIDRGNLIHELAHTWGIYVGNTLGITNITPGAQGHYNPSGHMVFGGSTENNWLDNGGDTMGGVDLLPVGDGTWISVTPSGNSSIIPRKFTELTLYLMGFLAPEEVPSMTLLKNIPDESTPYFYGQEQIVTIDDIIRESGVRYPSNINSQKDFKTAFILVTEKDKTPSSISTKQIENVVSTFPDFWARLTWCRSVMSTNLAKNNSYKCQPISSSKSSAAISSNNGLVKVNSVANLVITLRDDFGNLLSGRDVRIIPNKEGDTNKKQIFDQINNINARSDISKYGYLITDSIGQVIIPLYSTDQGSFFYYIVADGKYLDLKPKVEFVLELPATTTTPVPQNASLTGNALIEFVQQEKDLVTSVDSFMVNRLNGYILLQVQAAGQAWYLDPVSDLKYYLSDGWMAYNALRKFGLGITNADLAKIPVGIESRFQDQDTDGDGLADRLEEGLGTNLKSSDSDGDGYSDLTEIQTGYNPLGAGKLVLDSVLTNRLKGRILLQVQSKGEAWYVNPKDGKRYYMKDGEAAYQIMRFLSLGITNTDLRKIPVGEF